MSREMTFDFAVHLSADEMAAVQSWKDRHGVTSRSKAVRLLSMIGLRFSEMTESSAKSDMSVPFNLHLPADLHARLRRRSEQEGLTIGALVISQLREATPPGSRDRTWREPSAAVEQPEIPPVWTAKSKPKLKS